MYNPEIETMPRSELEALQGKRLVELVGRVYDAVPFYRRAFDQAGVDPASVRGLEELTRLPFTRKRDLRDAYPFGMFAIPREQVIRIHASSGTTGKPTVVGYSRADLDLWAEVCARSLVLSGARPGDIFQNAYGYGLFTGGLGMHYGAERLGMSVVPVSGGNTARQIMLLQDFGSDVMACTPSYALALADALAERGVDPASLRVRVFILGAEPWSEAMRGEIEARLHADAVNIYGLSEIIGPGVSNESVVAKNGAHIFEDHFLPEIVDPASGEPLPDGEVGELVFTTLTKEAMPLIRYRTGDLCSLTREPCDVTGHTHARMSRIVGRVDDMLIVRGINVYPSQIEAALLGEAHVAPHYALTLRRAGRLDELEVRVEVTDGFFREVGSAALSGAPVARAERARALRERLELVLHEALGIRTTVSLLAPGQAPRSEGGKLSRVQDLRDVNA